MEFGAGALVTRTIASALAQTATDVQVIVATAAADPEARLDRLGDDLARCEVVHRPGSALGELLQLGLERSRGLYVKFALPGDELVPRCVERQLATAFEYPQPSVTFCRAAIADPSSGVRWLGALTCSGGNVLRELLRGVPPPLGAALLSRAALEAVGGFDPTFVARADADLWLRLLPDVAVRGSEEVLLAATAAREEGGGRGGEIAAAEFGRALVAAFQRSGSDHLLRALGDGGWLDLAAARIEVARRLVASGLCEGRLLAHRLVTEALAEGATWPDDEDLASLGWLVPEARRKGIPASLQRGGSAGRSLEPDDTIASARAPDSLLPFRVRVALWWDDIAASGGARLLERAEELGADGIDLVCVAVTEHPQLAVPRARGVAVEVVWWPDSRDAIVAVLDRWRVDAMLIGAARPAAAIARAAGCVVIERLADEGTGPLADHAAPAEHLLRLLAGHAAEQRRAAITAVARMRGMRLSDRARADAVQVAVDGLLDPASCTGRARTMGWSAQQSGDLIEIAREASALAALGTELRGRAERLLEKLRIMRRAEAGVRALRGILGSRGKVRERRLAAGALETFVAAALAARPAWLWVIYATDPYSETRGQRSTWLAQEIARRGHHVIYLYWRWTPAEPIAPSGDERVLTVPIDQLPAVQGELFALTEPQSQLGKVFLAEFPDWTLFERVSLFAAHGFVTVYDVIDEWAEFARVGQAHWYDAAVERHLARCADVVVATHPLLAKKIGTMGDRPVPLVPNAVRLDSLHAPSASREASKSPVVGYFGHLTSSWFDWDLVVESAARNPRWRYEIIGYGEPADLELPANVALLGKVPHAELSQRSAHWSAAIIPFRTGPLTRAVDPVKLYEYLALGLSVVAVDMPHLASVPGVVVCDRDGFDAAVEQCLASALDRARVASFLADSTWQRRVDALLGLVTAVDPARNVLRALAG